MVLAVKKSRVWLRQTCIHINMIALKTQDTGRAKKSANIHLGNYFHNSILGYFPYVELFRQKENGKLPRSQEHPVQKYIGMKKQMGLEISKH